MAVGQTGTASAVIAARPLCVDGFFKNYRLKAGRILRDWKSWLRLEAA
jgi:hypothetical protein